MSQDSLRELLSRVHERLGQSGPVDPQSRELLGTVMRDIERALGDKAAATAKPPAAPRLEALAVKFEAEHSALAQLLRQLATLLGQAGI
jgi:Domain of unknown function (DUF4404)